MSEPTYTIKEILDIQFKGIEHKLDANDKKSDLILQALKDQDLQTEKRFGVFEKELQEIKRQQEKTKIEFARYQVIWGMGATIGAALVAFTLNRIF